MASSPATVSRVPARARDSAGRARGHTPPTLQVNGHAALAIGRRGGSPTHRHLDEALALRLDRIEIDICCSADGVLVVRHDVGLGDGRFVGDLDLAALRRHDPFLLTLDDVEEHLAGRVPILLDLKMGRASVALGAWMRGRRDVDTYAVCTENLPWLRHLHAAAPRLARWPSFPDLGDRSRHHVQRVLAGLWRSHATLQGVLRSAADVNRAARHLRRRPHDSLARIAGLPWRDRLPLDFAHPCGDLAAAGMCVQQWLVSERLIEEAHRAGLHVCAWTINNPEAAQDLAAVGVDSITTDRVAAIRLALGIGQPPPHPASDGDRLREAARSVPI